MYRNIFSHTLARRIPSLQPASDQQNLAVLLPVGRQRLDFADDQDSPTCRTL